MGWEAYQGVTSSKQLVMKAGMSESDYERIINNSAALNIINTAASKFGQVGKQNIVKTFKDYNAETTKQFAKTNNIISGETEKLGSVFDFDLSGKAKSSIGSFIGEASKELQAGYNNLLGMTEEYQVLTLDTFNDVAPSMAAAISSFAVGAGVQINYTAQRRRISGSVGGRFAEGGFPSKYQLFMARENGIPEMVGAIGSQPAVANNDQIVAAIAYAVKAAILETGANGNNNNGDINVNMYVGGKQLTDVVVEDINGRTRRNGRSPLVGGRV